MMGEEDAESIRLKDRLDRSADLFATAADALSASTASIDAQTAEAICVRARKALAGLETAEAVLVGHVSVVTGALDQQWRLAMEDGDENARQPHGAALISRLSLRKKNRDFPMAAETMVRQLRSADMPLDACRSQRMRIVECFMALEAALDRIGEMVKADRRALDVARRDHDKASHHELELSEMLACADVADDEGGERLRLRYSEATAARSQIQQQLSVLELQVEANENVLEEFEALMSRARRYLSALDLTAALTKIEIERAVMLFAAASGGERPNFEGHTARVMELMRDGLLSAPDVAARHQQAARAFNGRFRDEDRSGTVTPEGGQTT